MCVDGGSVVKQSAWTQELWDTASTPGWGRNPGGGHDDPPQHSCLENPPRPRSRLAAVHRSRRVGHDWSDLARTDHVSLHRYYNISTETLHCFNLGLPGGSVIKSWLANSGDVGSIPGLGRSLQEEMATHYSVLDWKIPWTEEPGGLQSMGSQKSWTRLSEWAHRPAAPL